MTKKTKNYEQIRTGRAATSWNQDRDNLFMSKVGGATNLKSVGNVKVEHDIILFNNQHSYIKRSDNQPNYKII